MNNEQYADMLTLPHHISTRYPRMSIQARAAQFSPFDALSGYSEALTEAARITERQIFPHEDVKAKIDRILCEAAATGRPVNLIYFVPDPQKPGGTYLLLSAVCVQRVDALRKRIFLKDGRTIAVERIIRAENAFPEP